MIILPVQQYYGAPIIGVIQSGADGEYPARHHGGRGTCMKGL